MFEWWNLRMGNTKQYDEPSMIKNNYRSAQNSKGNSKGLKRRKDLEYGDGIGTPWRVLQFTDIVVEPKEPDETDPSITDPNGGIAVFDPGEAYADIIVDGEFEEVKNGNQKWEITVTAFGKNRTELWSYTYDFAREGFGKKKLLVYVNGKRAKNLGENLKKNIHNLDIENLNLDYPIDPSLHKMFSEEFFDPRDTKKPLTTQDTFCPGFILEVDNCFNVFVTRLSMARIYYGHHGEQNQWQKLEWMKDGKRYLDSMESQDGVKQMVFSYKKFIRTSRVYENWLEQGKPEISLVDSKVLMPVDNVPSMQRGCDSGCDFFFEIEHKPARKIYKQIRRREEQNPPSIFVSDPLDDLFGNMTVNNENNGVNNVHYGANNVHYGANNVQNGANNVYYGANSVQDGVISVHYVVNNVQNGVNNVQHGVNNGDYGANNVHNGANNMQNGVSSVQNGAGFVQNEVNSVQNEAGTGKTYSISQANAMDTNTFGICNLCNCVLCSCRKGFPFEISNELRTYYQI
ncbi:uncharacterized protein LOC134815216 [Bolinopsis microptera]|uniref:uncharacterized protein LOC134815216 n=1 Tax=Bolinopsis microptera TaxID=2820187 RepID=UPI00307AE705